MKFEHKILIISLIFAAGLYTLLILYKDIFFANSFLIGVIVVLFDFYALSRALRNMLSSGAGWLFVPIGMFRLLLTGVVLFLSFYLYKADPLMIIIGVSVPVAVIFLSSIYKFVWGKGNGTSS